MRSTWLCYPRLAKPYIDEAGRRHLDGVERTAGRHEGYQLLANRHGAHAHWLGKLQRQTAGVVAMLRILRVLDGHAFHGGRGQRAGTLGFFERVADETGDVILDGHLAPVPARIKNRAVAMASHNKIADRHGGRHRATGEARAF